MNRLIIVIVLVLNASMINAQNVFEDIKKINLAYVINPDFSMDINYKTQILGNEKIPIDTEEGFIRKKGNLIHLKMGHVETIKSNKLQLTIDHKKKTIILTTPIIEDNSLTDNLTATIQQVLNYASKVDYVKESQNTGKYILEFPSKRFEKMEFDFNINSWFLTRVVVFASQSRENEESDIPETIIDRTKSEIIYSKINLAPSFTKDEFTTWNYVYKKGETYITSDNYIGYKIFNQIPVK